MGLKLNIMLVVIGTLFLAGIPSFFLIDALSGATAAVTVDVGESVSQLVVGNEEPSFGGSGTEDSSPEAVVEPAKQKSPVKMYLGGGRNKDDDFEFRKTSQRVLDRLQSEDKVRVIIDLNDKSGQEEVLNALSSFDFKVDMKNGFAGYLDVGDLQRLEESGLVDYIYEDRPLHVANAESFPLIQADKAASATYNQFVDLTGAGQTVCVIDTGVDVGHNDLGDCTGSEYVNGNCDKTISGWNYLTGLNDPYDSNGHGTAIAGIIAGNGSGYQGIAPEAKIVSLKVVDSDNTAYESDVGAAVQWCTDNATKFNITMISIAMVYDHPIFDYNEHSDCDGDPIMPYIDDAVANNITVFAPTGNTEDVTEISMPACGTNTIAVSAVADGSGSGGDSAADEIPNNPTDGWGPNRYPGMTDLMAPGQRLYVLRLESAGSYIGGKGGTSYASAHAIGSAMLLKEYFEERYSYDLTPDEIRNILSITGKPIYDINTSAYYPRLDLLAAMNHEWWLPTVTLETPLDAATENEGVITFNYNTVDNEHEIKNCSLYIDGSLDQTDTTITENVTQSFNVDLAAGAYDWQVKCYDNSTIPNEGVSEIRTINVQAACTEDWVEQFGSCLVNDSQLKTYIDNNSCGTTNDLPAGNGTYVGCNYCSYSVTNTTWTVWESTETCQITDLTEQNRSKTEYDENYETCYAITGLASDLWNSGNNNTYWEYQNISCNYCSYSVVNTTWTSWQDVGVCLVNDTQEQNRSKTEYDENYSTCYAVTTLPTDLWNSGNNNTYWGFQNIACDYCTPIWVEVNDSCQPDDTQTGWFNDTNECFAITSLLSDNNPPANNTYTCDFCTSSMVNTSWSSWYDVSACYANDTKDQERNLTEYDDNYCGEVSNTTYFEYQSVACDACTPNLVNTSWSAWTNTTGCLANDTVDQERNLTQYDNNYCGEVSNSTYFEYQIAACDACIPSLANTSWTSWYDTSACYANDTKDQERNLTQYDGNYCGEVSNTTYFEYQTTTCDFCTPNLVNTSWTAWYNISICYANNTVDHERNLTEYDDNYCGEISNTTYYEYQSVACTSPECFNDSDCDDGLYCNGNETCNAGTCEVGTDIDCSPFDLSPFSVCDFAEEVPADNPFTWDVFAGFTSMCDEDADACTAGETNSTSSCDIANCGAECEVNADCLDTDCDALDGCVGDDWHDYNNVSNSCLADCSCESNPCGVPTITANDPRCYTPPTCYQVCTYGKCYDICV